MKKIILSILSILLLSTSANAFEMLAKGTFTCTYTKDNQEKTCAMHSDGKGTVFFNGDCEAVDNEVQFVKQNTCTHNRSATKIYICDYADTSCSATFYGNGANSVSCNNKKNFQYENKFETTDKVIEQAKSGKCRPQL